MNDHTYGTNLKKVRKKMKLSQKQLAKDICSQAMLSRIENNEVIPNALIMKEICNRLNISVEEIMDGESSSSTQESRDFLEKMQYLHQTHQYTRLSLLISQQHSLPAYWTKKELQLYHYYKACALSSLAPHSNDVPKLLQESLDCTYSIEQNNASDMEIILLSELGRLYLSRGETNVGLAFMKKSLNYFSCNPAKRTNIELVRAMYHVGTAFISHHLYNLAEKAVEQGITWAQKKHILYYLDQLFLLKGIIEQKHEQIPETLESVRLIDTLTSAAVRHQNLSADI